MKLTIQKSYSNHKILCPYFKKYMFFGERTIVGRSIRDAKGSHRKPNLFNLIFLLSSLLRGALLKILFGN